MKINEYIEHDAVGLSRLIAAGSVSGSEVESVAREALELANRDLNALALPVFSEALEDAEEGPLAGVPFLLKDSGPLAKGMPFFLGSRSLVHAVAPYDSALMTRCRAAGLATLGLTSVPEFTLSFSTESAKHGPTRNPWDLKRGVGGSSGGLPPWLRLARCRLPMAMMGPGRSGVPASCCGVVGLKPTRGRTMCGLGFGEAMFGACCEFGLTRTVRDAAVFLDAIHGPAVGEKYTAPPPAGRYVDEVDAAAGRLRVAVAVEAWSGVNVDPEVAKAAVATCRVLEDMGHQVSEAAPRVDWPAVVESFAVSVIVFVAGVFRRTGRSPDQVKLEAVSRRILEEARHLSSFDVWPLSMRRTK